MQRPPSGWADRLCRTLAPACSPALSHTLQEEQVNSKQAALRCDGCAVCTGTAATCLTLTHAARLAALSADDEEEDSPSSTIRRCRAKRVRVPDEEQEEQEEDTEDSSATAAEAQLRPAGRAGVVARPFLQAAQTGAMLARLPQSDNEAAQQARLDLLQRLRQLGVVSEAMQGSVPSRACEPLLEWKPTLDDLQTPFSCCMQQREPRSSRFVCMSCVFLP
jgi:hypothetical protein